MTNGFCSFCIKNFCQLLRNIVLMLRRNRIRPKFIVNNPFVATRFPLVFEAVGPLLLFIAHTESSIVRV